MSGFQQKNHTPQEGQVRLPREKNIQQLVHVRLSAERAHCTGRTFKVVSRKIKFHRQDIPLSDCTGRIFQIVSSKSTYHRQDMLLSECLQKKYIPQTGHVRLSAERGHSAYRYIRLPADRTYSINRTNRTCQIVSSKNPFHIQNKQNMSDCLQKYHIPHTE